MSIIVAASKNQHKIKEIEAITKEFGMEIIPRDKAGVPDVEIEEDGSTFEENSRKKAYEIMKLCGEITIADDSGLEVDCLDGAPGVFSARFAGEDGNDQANNDKLKSLIKDVPYEQTNRPVCICDYHGVSGWRNSDGPGRSGGAYCTGRTGQQRIRV